MTKRFELKLASGRVVVWEGSNWEHAARRYVDAHPEDAVVAWRNADRYGVFPVHAAQLEG